MGRHTDQTDRVLGPTFIPSRSGTNKWRLITLQPTAGRPDRRRNTRWFATEEQARAIKEALDQQFAHRHALTIGAAIGEYEQHLKDKAPEGSKSYVEIIRRLKLFFPKHDLRTSRVTPELAEELYEKFRARVKPDGKPISVAYHRATLINARSLMKWCVRRKMIPTNPFADVEGIGTRKRGKAQHTGDEAGMFYRHCLPLAQAGNKNALAALMQLLMALRSKDLWSRIVRDVDFNGTVLRVQEGKSDKSNRPRHVPLVLQAPLRALVAGREPTEPLFFSAYTENGFHTGRWLQQAVAKLCRDAGLRRVVPHALKGTAGSVLAQTGELADRIADHLSHEDKATTEQHYVEGGLLATKLAEKGAEAITTTAIYGVITGTKSSDADGN